MNMRQSLESVHSFLTEYVHEEAEAYISLTPWAAVIYLEDFDSLTALRFYNHLLGQKTSRIAAESLHDELSKFIYEADGDTRFIPLYSPLFRDVEQGELTVQPTLLSKSQAELIRRRMWDVDLFDLYALALVADASGDIVLGAMDAVVLALRRVPYLAPILSILGTIAGQITTPWQMFEYITNITIDKLESFLAGEAPLLWSRPPNALAKLGKLMDWAKISTKPALYIASYGDYIKIFRRKVYEDTQ